MGQNIGRYDVKRDREREHQRTKTNTVTGMKRDGEERGEDLTSAADLQLRLSQHPVHNTTVQPAMKTHTRQGTETELPHTEVACEDGDGGVGVLVEVVMKEMVVIVVCGDVGGDGGG